MSETDFFLGLQGVPGSPIDPTGPGGKLIEPTSEFSAGPVSPTPAIIQWDGSSWTYVTPPTGGGGGFLNNFTATVDPTSNDDSTSGYSVGSQWLNKTTGVLYEAISVVATAAIWTAINSPNVKGNVIAYTKQFFYNTPGPVVLGLTEPGDLIIEARLNVLVPFDPSATISIGNTVNAGAFLGPNESLPDQVDIYVNDMIDLGVSVADAVRVTISPGSSNGGVAIATAILRKG